MEDERDVLEMDVEASVVVNDGEGCPRCGACTSSLSEESSVTKGVPPGFRLFIALENSYLGT